MSGIEVRTFLRQPDGTALPLDDVDRIERKACAYLQGSIALSVDGVEVMTPSLWDDVNWLWPSVIGAFDDCRRIGAGQIMFPSQPIRFEVEELRTWKPILRVSVKGVDLEQARGRRPGRAVRRRRQRRPSILRYLPPTLPGADRRARSSRRDRVVGSRKIATDPRRTRHALPTPLLLRRE